MSLAASINFRAASRLCIVPGQAASRGRRVAVLVVSFWVWGRGDSLGRGRIRRARAKIDGDCIPDGICPANKHLKIF
jgi:hypothetical protein